MQPSQSALNRQQGKHQVDEQRNAILLAAEKLFLEKGLDKTQMMDIAAAAGISKVTLYRYFPHKDAIAVEVQIRMLERIAAAVGLNAETFEPSLETVKVAVQRMVRSFDRLRDAYRYIGMFDSLYLDHPFDAEISQRTKDRLRAHWKGLESIERSKAAPESSRAEVILSAAIWFLEKIALRGELTWSHAAIPLEAHLDVFEEMVAVYIEHCLRENASKDN
ncbi:MAG: TetR/AcrR family transcriptional regulator [Caldilinea sp.]|nr:TetR/AcrR family transcriptional regulator [Caldilinea sp.]MDW8439149.1 TetR/AcrR family transcriptional regulator [Caldilineaceae bacterium]